MTQSVRIHDRLAAETRLAQALAGTRGDLARYLARGTTAEERRLALELHALRTRAAGRLWSSESLLLTSKGLEQASASCVSAWRARRVDARDPEYAPLVDLTAGLGLDAAALAGTRRVVAQDLDPDTAAVCGVNLGRLAPGRAQAVRADALRPAARTPWLMVDPDRRPGGRRELDPGRWSPSWAACALLLAGAEGGVAKLAPSADPEVLEAALPTGLGRSWSFVGRGRELIELTLWTGRLADPEASVEALRVDPEGQVEARLAGAPGPDLPPLAAERAAEAPWIVEPHAAVLRSGLVAELAPRHGLAPLGPHLGFLGPLEPATPPPDASPLWTVRRVLGAASADPKRVRQMLAEHDVGAVHVRVRGHPESADRLARRFRGKGSRPGQLLVARLARGHRVYLVDAGERAPT